MKNTKLTAITAALAVTLLVNAPSAFTQDAPPAAPAAPAADATAAPGAPGAAAGDRMEQFRQRMSERLKTSLKASDEEWGVIQPLLEKVQAAQRKTMGARMGGFGAGGDRRGMRRGGDNAKPATDSAKPAGDSAKPAGDANAGGWGGRASTPEADALKSVLDAEGSTPADIKAKLEALRESRKQAATELTQAQDELRKVLSQRQEATLVLMGVLQ